MAEPKDNLFGFHKLNVTGQDKAVKIQELYENFLSKLQKQIGDGQYGREAAIMRSKLEESCFYAKKAMASLASNQE